MGTIIVMGAPCIEFFQRQATIMFVFSSYILELDVHVHSSDEETKALRQ